MKHTYAQNESALMAKHKVDREKKSVGVRTLPAACGECRRVSELSSSCSRACNTGNSFFTLLVATRLASTHFPP